MLTVGMTFSLLALRVRADVQTALYFVHMSIGCNELNISDGLFERVSRFLLVYTFYCIRIVSCEYISYSLGIS